MPRPIFGKSAPLSPSDHLFVACLIAAKANHFLVTVARPNNYDYDDACRAAQEIMDRHNCGRISYAMEGRALMFLSDATGYSLTDLGA